MQRFLWQRLFGYMMVITIFLTARHAAQITGRILPEISSVIIKRRKAPGFSRVGTGWSCIVSALSIVAINLSWQNTEVKSSYLLCYLGAGNAMILHSAIWASSMGEALQRADEEKAKHNSTRWFVIHAYEVANLEELL